MKTIKRICIYLFLITALLSFSLYSSSAEIHKDKYYYRLVYDKFSANFHDLNGTVDSYASASATDYQAANTDLKCSTTAVNEHYGSVNDHMYMTVAYVSLYLKLESGEELFYESASRCGADFSVTEEINASCMAEYKQSDVIKHFESNHKRYHYFPKYSIWFAHGDVLIETIVVEKFEKKPTERSS